MEIFKNLLEHTPTPDTKKNANEVLIIKDVIIPTLNENLESSEFAQLYPFRAIFAYDLLNKDDHIQ